MTDSSETQPAPPTLYRRPLRRIGCLVGLLLWALLMLTPCGLFLLATQGQLTISLGSAPNQEVRLWLVNEARVRGLALSWPSVRPSGDTTLCVQTETRFLLWAGSGEPATFCDCYGRTSPNEPWLSAESYTGSCQP